MKIRKLLSVLLSGVMAFSFMATNVVNASAAKSYSDKVSVTRVWDGTADIDWFTNDKDSYNIYTAEELAGLMKVLDDDLQGDCLKGITINLMNDIVLNDTSNFKNWEKEAPKNVWRPGGYNKGALLGYGPFAGVFNGNGHTISGMYSSVYNWSPFKISGDAGLFECTAGAVIKDLKMEKCYAWGAGRAGIVTAVSQGTYFENVEVKDCKAFASDHAGGISGVAYEFVDFKFAALGLYTFITLTTGMLLNPLFLSGDVGVDVKKNTMFMACKAENCDIKRVYGIIPEGAGNMGGIIGGTALETSFYGCLSINNTFEGKKIGAITANHICEKKKEYFKKNYEYNSKTTDGKKAVLADDKHVSTVSKSTLYKKSFAQKFDDIYKYKKGETPSLAAIIDTPVDVVLNEKKATISWDKVDNATKYKVYIKKNGKYSTISTTKTTSAALKNINKGKSYEIMIRAYFKDGSYKVVDGGQFKFKA